MKKINLLVYSSIILIMASCNSSEKSNGDTYKTSMVEPKNFDLNVMPGDDFYRYVNGSWLRNNPIPDDQTMWASFIVLNEENQLKIKEIIEDASNDKNATAGSISQKIGDFYNSGMDTVNIEKKGYSEMEPYFEKIKSLNEKSQLYSTVAELHSFGLAPFFNFYVAQDEMKSTDMIANLFQGGITLPDKSYYLDDDERAVEIRSEYLKYVTKMFELFGYQHTDANEYSNTVFQIEKELASNSFSRVDLRDPYKNYNKMEIKDLQKISPEFNWEGYFSEIKVDPNSEINAGQKTFFEQLSAVIKNHTIAEFKVYLLWNVMVGGSQYLNSAIQEESFNFFGRQLSGSINQKPRWKRVLVNTDRFLGELVGQQYVKKFFPPEAKDKINDLVLNIRKSLKERISGLEWMSDETKQKALEKLEAINCKLGYPDKWIDYSKLNITKDSYLANVFNAQKFSFEYDIAKIGKPVDKDEWHMTPQTINAYYSPNMNEIVFPAAILQPPFFDYKADDAVNYGAIGAVIGHEITHGFDDQGKLYDKNGNLSTWWTKDDEEKFNSKAQILVQQYDSIIMLDSLHINGKLTLGENIADLGGVTISLNALKNLLKTKEAEPIDDFTPIQRFFISYAQVWKINIRDKELMRRLKEDVHSPGEARVNGIVYNIPDFYAAFNIGADSKKYITDDKRALIW